MASADRGLPGGGAAHLVRATGRAGRVRIRSPGKRSATGETCRHGCRTTETQKAHPAGWAFYLFDAWQFPTLTWGDPTLPSALRRFTSEFGMGSGGTTALSPPGKFCFTSPSYDALVNLYQAENRLKSPKQLRRCKVKPHGSLVPVSSTHRCAYTPGLSTSSSSTFLQETYSLRENSSRGKFRA